MRYSKRARELVTFARHHGYGTDGTRSDHPPGHLTRDDHQPRPSVRPPSGLRHRSGHRGGGKLRARNEFQWEISHPGVHPSNVTRSPTPECAPIVDTELPSGWSLRPQGRHRGNRGRQQSVCTLASPSTGISCRPRTLQSVPMVVRSGGSTVPAFTLPPLRPRIVTNSVGDVGPHGAYFWGPGGNVVKVTTDEGVHWWVSGFAAGVYKVTRTHGILRTVALANELQSGAFQAFLYVSANSGMTWNLRGQLRNVTP